MSNKVKFRLIISAMVLLLVAGGVYRLVSIFGGSSEGSISVAQPIAEAPDVQSSRIPVSNTYADFSHAAFLTETAVDKPVAPVVANHSLVKQQFSPWQGAVQVVRLQSGSLSDAGTYNYRNTTKAQFTKAQRTIGQHQATVFTDTTAGGFSQAVYIQKGSLAASFVLSGGTSQQTTEMQAELDAIVTSWQWR